MRYEPDIRIIDRKQELVVLRRIRDESWKSARFAMLLSIADGRNLRSEIEAAVGGGEVGVRRDVVRHLAVVELAVGDHVEVARTGEAKFSY